MKKQKKNVEGIDDDTSILINLMEEIVEQNHDKKGIVWPEEIAPFDIYLAPDLRSADIKNFSDNLYDSLHLIFDILYDDRKTVSIREKVKKACFIGIPYIVVLNQSKFKKGYCDVIFRKSLESEEVAIVDIDKYLIRKMYKK